MSINTAMTSIADRIRGLLGLTGTMGLDAIASNLAVEQANIADAFAAVSSKGGTVPDSQVSGNLAAAIETIPLDVTVQREIGTFITDSNGDATVNCGFQPDVVYLLGENGAGLYSQAIVFAEELRDGIPVTVMWASDGLIETHWTQTQTGFTTHIEYQDWSFNATYYSEETISYVAIKYT